MQIQLVSDCEGTAVAFSMSKYGIQVDIISKCYIDLLGLKRSLLLEATNTTTRDLKFCSCLNKICFHYRVLHWEAEILPFHPVCRLFSHVIHHACIHFPCLLKNENTI